MADRTQVCICVWKVDSFPRRTLLAAGTVCIAGGLAVLTVGFALHEDGPAVWISVPAMALIAAAYSFSFGPLCWLVTGTWPYNRPCAQQYVGKSQSCMVISG